MADGINRRIESCPREQGMCDNTLKLLNTFEFDGASCKPEP